MESQQSCGCDLRETVMKNHARPMIVKENTPERERRARMELKVA